MSLLLSRQAPEGMLGCGKVWQRKLNSLIRRHQDEIDHLLADAGVPLVRDMGDGMLEVGQ